MRVRVAPSNVTAGNSLVIAAGVRPAVKGCAATVARPGAAPRKLAKKTARTGADEPRVKSDSQSEAVT